MYAGDMCTNRPLIPVLEQRVESVGLLQLLLLGYVELGLFETFL